MRGVWPAREHGIDILQDLAFFLYAPLTWLLPIGALLAWRWSRMGRAARAIGGVLLAVSLLLCTPLGANALVRLLEAQVPDPASCRDVSSPIVLLSGGFDRPPLAEDDYPALSTDSWRRLHAAVRLQRAHPDATLWISGGGPFAVKESDVLGRLARDWGVPAYRLRMERTSATTWDSAIALRASLPPRIVLASSAVHLPRALIAFRAAGFAPCAVPTDSRYVASRTPGTLVPQALAIEKADDALYEMVGIAYYGLRARRAAAGAPAAAQ